MLFSKNPNLHLPNLWPTYYSRTHGSKIWDLDNKKFLDMYLMGVGTNMLGYNNAKVDRAVKETIQKGNLFGVQFHPEKSRDAGIRIFQNFINL